MKCSNRVIWCYTASKVIQDICKNLSISVHISNSTLSLHTCSPLLRLSLIDSHRTGHYKHAAGTPAVQPITEPFLLVELLILAAGGLPTLPDRIPH